VRCDWRQSNGFFLYGSPPLNDAARYKRNAKLYLVYTGAGSALLWLPVFFLFFRSHLPLVKVLQLEALYYLSVVLLEFPSGYFSDRVGRKVTLIISSSCWLLANAAFFLGASFEAFAIGQVLLAGGMAFRSGTDASFHLESLQAFGHEGEYANREARAARIRFLASAAGAVAGGAVALIALRWAYAASALTAAVALGTALLFVEPPASEQRAFGVLRQLVACLHLLKKPALAWLFAFAVIRLVLDHIPYEFYQPYIKELGLSFGMGSDATPLVTGLHMAGTTFIAAWIAGRSIQIRDRIGLGPTLLLSPAIQTLLLAGMAFTLHPVIVGLLLFRSSSSALVSAPLNAAVNPEVPQHLRASYLSLISFVGRLGFSLTLFAFSQLAAWDGAQGWQQTTRILSAAVVLGAVGFVGLALSSRRAQLSHKGPAKLR